MPYPEIVLWRTFFQLEPWGFHNMEVQVARLLSMLHNIYSKPSKQKAPHVWVRDMLQQTLGSIRKEYSGGPATPFIYPETEEERKTATQQVIAGLKDLFGARLKDTRHP